jgi:AcrR family transcriptional regulator
MKKSPPQETINVLLNAAEELFAIHGYDGATLRNITQKARVNLAAAHYHIGDKKSLYVLILGRRLRPINESRLAALEQAELQAGGQPVPLARIIELMARPFFKLAADQSGGGHHFARLFGRSLSEPLPFMDEFLAQEFQPAMARFGQALRRHAPNLTPEEFLWRLGFVIGAMHHTLATLHRMKDLTRGICRNHDHAGALQRFIPFAAAAFSPSAGTGPDSSIPAGGV